MNIIIIGLGLIGGSIAKDLSEIKGINILGFDKNHQSIENALANKTINGFIDNLDELTIEKYNDSLVIIATPPRASLEILRALSSLFNSNITITDTSSAKSALEEILLEFKYPNNIVLSHPVAGSHLSGQENSLKGLFKNKEVILSYGQSVLSKHIEKVRNLWKSMNARISNLEGNVHDYVFAHSSHLPHVVSYALLMTLKNLDQTDISKFSGGGLGEFLRLASSSSEMWADIFTLNKENIISAIDALEENLDIIKSKINKDTQEIEALLLDLKNFKEENY